MAKGSKAGELSAGCFYPTSGGGVVEPGDQTGRRRGGEGERRAGSGPPGQSDAVAKASGGARKARNVVGVGSA